MGLVGSDYYRHAPWSGDLFVRRGARGDFWAIPPPLLLIISSIQEQPRQRADDSAEISEHSLDECVQQ